MRLDDNLQRSESELEKRKGLWTEPLGMCARHKKHMLYIWVHLYGRSTIGKSIETESKKFPGSGGSGGGEWPLHGDTGLPFEGDENVLELDTGWWSHHAVNVLNVTKPHSLKWLKCWILCLGILSQFKNNKQQKAHSGLHCREGTGKNRDEEESSSRLCHEVWHLPSLLQASNPSFIKVNSHRPNVSLAWWEDWNTFEATQGSVQAAGSCSVFLLVIWVPSEPMKRLVGGIPFPYPRKRVFDWLSLGSGALGRKVTSIDRSTKSVGGSVPQMETDGFSTWKRSNWCWAGKTRHIHWDKPSTAFPVYLAPCKALWGPEAQEVLMLSVLLQNKF